MSLARLWAGWRSEYIEGTAAAEAASESDPGCVMCRLSDDDQPARAAYVLGRAEHTTVALNAFPYTSGHLMVMPRRHIGDLEELDGPETAALWSTVTRAVRAVKGAYHPAGLNVGLNLGRAAGAGIPGHLHVHVLPRWVGDTNFMTSVAEARVLPEALDRSWEKLHSAWGDQST